MEAETQRGSVNENIRKRGHVLHSVFARRTVAFVALSFAGFFAVAGVCIAVAVAQVEECQVVQLWIWSLLLFLSFLGGALFDVWVIYSSTMEYFALSRPVKHVLSCLATGFATGLCMSEIMRAIVLTSNPSMCILLSINALLCLQADLEVRVESSPAPPTPIKRLSLQLCDISNFKHGLILSGLIFLTLHYLAGYRFSDVFGVLFTLLVPVGVLTMKLAFSSLLVNVIMHPVEFERLRPSSYDISKPNLLEENVYFTVQNYCLVFLLNCVSEGIGFEGIGFDEFLKSWDLSHSIPDDATISLIQAKFMSDIYHATSSKVELLKLSHFSAKHFGVPQPFVVSHGASQYSAYNEGPCGDGHKIFNDEEMLGPCTNLLKIACRTLALRDLNRLARVSPFRRSLIFRNPPLLVRTIFMLCSTIDFYTVQIELWIAHVSIRLNDSCGLEMIRSVFRTLGIRSEKYNSDVPLSLTGLRAQDKPLDSNLDKALKILLQRRSTRNKFFLPIILSSVVNAISFLFPSHCHPFFSGPLSRREAVDSINSIDTLSILALKSLREDSSGLITKFIPCIMRSILTMGVAIKGYLDLTSSINVSKASTLKLSRKPSSNEFESGEMQLLQLTLEEAVVRISKSYSRVVEVLETNSNAPVLPTVLLRELKRITRG